MWTKEPRPCDGCGEMSRHLTGVIVCPGAERSVCQNQGTSKDVPKESCVEKARAKARGCPGCGTQISPQEYKARTLCEGCHAIIRRGLAAPPCPMVWGKIDTDELLGDYISSDEGEAGELKKKLASALLASLGDRIQRHYTWREGEVELLLGNVHDRSSGFMHVEIPQNRVPAIKEFLATLAKLGTVLQAHGRAQGHSALYRLATGQVTPDDYAENLKRRR